MNEDNVTIHLTSQQWDFLFYMLNQVGKHVETTLVEAQYCMRTQRGELLSLEDAAVLRNRVLSQVINAGHPAS